VKWHDLSFGLAGNARLPRRPSDDRTLSQLNKVGLSIEAGGYIDYNPKGIDVSLEVRHDIAGGHGGTIAELNLRGQIQLGKKFAFEFGPNVTLADGKYMRSYFGITAAESARSGYARFKPDGGIKDFGFTVAGGYSFDQHWRLLGQVQYARLIDDAAESPIVKGRGSRNQFEFDLMLAYHF
jgi:outer membrane scaffolding protein for murein synthesis (MipA/OmpV family)